MHCKPPLVYSASAYNKPPRENHGAVKYSFSIIYQSAKKLLIRV